MNKINIEIKEIENGWIIEDSYFGNEKYFKEYTQASNDATKRLIDFQKELEEE